MTEQKKVKITSALSEIQQQLKAPKNQYNSFGKYNYRSCEDILEAVKPHLKKQKMILTITDELVNIGERYYIKATARLCAEGESIISTGYAREEDSKKGMDGSQITGASSSYARKYALNGLFLIDDAKDSDTTNVEKKPASKSKEKSTSTKKESEEEKDQRPIKEKLAELIRSQIDATDKKPEEFEAEFKMILDKIAGFEGNDGQPVFPESIEEMSEKWTYSAYGRLKKEIEEEATSV